MEAVDSVLEALGRSEVSCSGSHFICHRGVLHEGCFFWETRARIVGWGGREEAMPAGSRGQWPGRG